MLEGAEGEGVRLTEMEREGSWLRERAVLLEGAEGEGA